MTCDRFRVVNQPRGPPQFELLQQGHSVSGHVYEVVVEGTPRGADSRAQRFDPQPRKTLTAQNVQSGFQPVLSRFHVTHPSSSCSDPADSE
ncbi:hypothetical protein ACFOLD_15685 [Kocuria carniphila]|uniref:hypothetical protein n=1 Tax=Kocuria carniphila TaxID=262208 RepID=UPI00360C9CE1